MSNHAGLEKPSTMPITEARNGFAQLLEQVARKAGPVVITRNTRPGSVMLSVEQYERLVAAAPDPLASLEQGFDALVARMQRPAATAGVDRLFAATPSQLGITAVKAAFVPTGGGCAP